MVQSQIHVPLYLKSVPHNGATAALSNPNTIL